MDVRVAVTGAAGFVGTHVVRALVDSGARVTEVRRVPPSESHGTERVVSFDIESPPEDLASALGSPDALIHLAWSGLSDYRSLTHLDAISSHYRFLRAAVEGGIGVIVVAGTCLEYGLVTGRIDETVQPAPVTPYGFAKDVLRRELEFLKSSLSFSLAWGRLFYLYGPGQRRTSLVPTFEAAVASGAKSFDVSQQNPVRDYIDVRTAATALATIAMSGSDLGPINICSGEGVRVADFLRRYATDRGWSIDVQVGSRPGNDYEPSAFWGDRRKLDSALRRGTT